jgi:hypothetical protein
MKKLIYLALAVIFGLSMIGCSGMSSEQRRETYDLRNDVGDKPFVGGSSPEARNLARTQMYGY